MKMREENCNVPCIIPLPATFFHSSCTGQLHSWLSALLRLVDKRLRRRYRFGNQCTADLGIERLRYLLWTHHQPHPLEALDLLYDPHGVLRQFAVLLVVTEVRVLNGGQRRRT